jgi:endonuclease III
MNNNTNTGTAEDSISRNELIIKKLQKNYKNARIALDYKSHWQLLVSVILSAQCTDVMVNKVTYKLFNKYQNTEDYACLQPEDLEPYIKSTGFFRMKAKHIADSARIICSKYRGKVPKTMDDLLKLPGVARKTANIILGNAFGKVEGIAVDTHVIRISQRLRLVNPGKIGGKKKVEFRKNNEAILDYMKDGDAQKIEIELMKIVPKDLWFKITYMIIDHGRAICKAQNPKCDLCFLNSICPVSRI